MSSVTVGPLSRYSCLVTCQALAALCVCLSVVPETEKCVQNGKARQDREGWRGWGPQKKLHPPLSLPPGAPTVLIPEHAPALLFSSGQQYVTPSLRQVLPPKQGLCSGWTSSSLFWFLLLQPLSCSRPVWAQSGSPTLAAVRCGCGSAGPPRPTLLTAGTLCTRWVGDGVP